MKEATSALLRMVLVIQQAKFSTLLLKVSKWKNQLHHFLFLYGIKSYRVHIRPHWISDQNSAWQQRLKDTNKGNWMAMFIHFLCLYPLGLTIKLNFNISKVAYCYKGSSMKTAQLLTVRTALSCYPSFSLTFHWLFAFFGWWNTACMLHVDVH